MLETAIIGGGLCGLALAQSLHRQGRIVALFEGRSRLGGRILTVTSPHTGLALDLGPTWFWPETQPRMTKLVADLGLTSFPQHDEGTVRYLREADKKPDLVNGQSVHGGAQRVEGGMARLIESLAKDLPETQVRVGHVLTRVRDQGEYVSLTFSVEGRDVEVQAERVVLALPPRLLEETVRFEPALDAAVREAMREAGTWMAAQAKVLITYDEPYWRKDGQSGNAFASHEQAVIGEIYDACDSAAEKAALGGFLALPSDLRRTFSAGLSMLMGSQMTQIFGPALETGEQVFQDWAEEPLTCSTLDRTAPETEHVGVSNPLLRRAQWGGKLVLGGSETAAYGAGYLEGALDAAHRVEAALSKTWSAAAPSLPHGSLNDKSLAEFSAWVGAQAEAAFEGYYTRLKRSLDAGEHEQVTRQAVTGSLKTVFDAALDVLDTLPFDMTDVAVERGRSALTPEVQKPFGPLMQALLDDVVAFNRTSKALAGRPNDQSISKDDMQAIIKDVGAAWQEFSLSANALLLAKAGPAGPRGGGKPGFVARPSA